MNYNRKINVQHGVPNMQFVAMQMVLNIHHRLEMKVLVSVMGKLFKPE
jgi:hypothetical protein